MPTIMELLHDANDKGNALQRAGEIHAACKFEFDESLTALGNALIAAREQSAPAPSADVREG